MTNKVRTIADVIGGMAWLTLIGGVIGLLLSISGSVITAALLLFGALWTSVMLWGAAYGLRVLVTIHDQQAEAEKRLDYLIKQQMRNKPRG